jgi:D-alanine-D-alanine ligase
MKICIINDDDIDSRQFPYQPEVYLKNHTWEKHFVTKGDAVIKIKTLASKGFDVFLNLCCGAFDEDSPGEEIPKALVRFDLAFTGADSVFY